MSDQNFTDSEDFNSVKQNIVEESGVKDDNDSNEIDHIVNEEKSSSENDFDLSSQDISELELPEVKEKGKLPDWVEERIKIKNKKIAARDAEIEELKNKLTQFSSSNQSNYKDNFAVSQELPSRDNFESENEWVSAIFEHKLREKEENDRIVNQQNQYIMELKAHEKKVEEKTAKGDSKYHDFEQVTAPLFTESFPANGVLSQEIFNSEHAEDILYFFGKYPEKAREIALMPPNKVIRKIYDLEKRFEEASKKKKSSNGEDYTPSPKIKGGGSGSNLSWESMSNMNQDDFNKAYDKKFGSKRAW